jgi:hypothetical protein
VSWAAFCFLLTLSLNPGVPPGQLSEKTDAGTWLTFVKLTCEEYNVDPAFALGLWQIESSLPGGPTIRLGRLGRTQYYGPGGLFRGCKILKGLDLDNPWVATWASVQALKGTGFNEAAQKRRLRSYNAQWTPRYERDVMAAKRKWVEKQKANSGNSP